MKGALSFISAPRVPAPSSSYLFPAESLKTCWYPTCEGRSECSQSSWGTQHTTNGQQKECGKACPDEVIKNPKKRRRGWRGRA